MLAPASRRQPSARSRMLSSTGSPRAGRGLGDVVTGVVHGVSEVVHDVSDVAHDVGHAVDDVLSGKLSKLPEDIAKTTVDVVKTGKDALEVVPAALDPSFKHNSGDPSHSGGGDGGTEPRPPPAPGSGGGEGTALQPSRPSSSQTPASTTPPALSTSLPSEYTEPAPSTSTTPADGAMDVGSKMPSGIMLAEPTDPHAQGNDGSIYVTRNGVSLAPSFAAFAKHSSTTMDALPSNGSGGGGTAHRKGFPLAAAAALGAVLGFLVVSALFWTVWLYLRKRRRSFHAVYLPPKRMLSVTSGRTVSTVPLFISASEAGVKDENPFKHPRDAEEEEGDPFDAASLWRSSTTRSASTLSV